MAIGFFDIPPELRLSIYAYVWADRPIIRLKHRSNTVESPATDANTPVNIIPYPPQDETLHKATRAPRHPDFQALASDHIKYDFAGFVFEYPSPWNDPSTTTNRHRTHLRATHEVDLTMLKVNRKIKTESLPIFYAKRTFHFNADPSSILEFFIALPATGRANITSISLGQEAVIIPPTGMTARCPGAAWRRRTEKTNTMSTIFGRYLAAELPKLHDVALFTPYQNNTAKETDLMFRGTSYVNTAYQELYTLLRNGRIESVHHVFAKSRKVEKALSKRTKEGWKCMRKCMGELGEGKAFLRWEFEMNWEREGKKGVEEWREKRRVFVDREKGKFGWRWGSREGFANGGIGLSGSLGEVGAVVSVWIDERGGDE